MTQSTAQLLRRAFRAAPALGVGIRLTIAMAMMGQAISIVTPIVMQSVIDDEILNSQGIDISGVWVKVGLAIAALALGTIVARTAVLRLVRSSTSGLSDLRSLTFAHLLRRSVLHVESSRRGVLVARVTSDVETVQEFMEWGGVGLIISSSQVLLALAAMVYYEWRLAALSIVVMVVYLVFMRFFQKRLRARYDRVRSEVGKSLGVLGESIASIPVVRAYGIEEETRDRVDEAMDRRFRAEFSAARFGASLFSTAEIFSGVLTTSLIVGGVLLGAQRGMTVGTLVAFMFLATLLVEPLQMMVQMLDQAQSAASGLRRILGVLDTEIEIQAAPDATPLRPGGLSVRFSDVAFSYDTGGEVIKGVSVEIPVGSRVAVVGETGSGKTTFAKLLVRLLDPSRGTIHVGERALASVDLDDLRSRVAFVPQEGFLFDESIADNVRYGATQASDAEVWSAFHELGLGEWVDSLPDGLNTKAGERGGNLSAGERQLIALVRAWIGSPDLLVLDEATSAVDPALDVALRHAIDRLTEGRTSVTIAHRLSTAEGADNVLVFDRGKIVESGTHRELLGAGGVYAGLHSDWIAGTKTV